MEDIILKLEDITKIYSNGTVANKDINIEFKKGEIHSIVGENGAGKSTLMKIIFAIEKQTLGKIYHKGEEVHYQNSMEAINHGIGMVHQHFMLIPSFTEHGEKFLPHIPLTLMKKLRRKSIVLFLTAFCPMKKDCLHHQRRYLQI